MRNAVIATASLSALVAMSVASAGVIEQANAQHSQPTSGTWLAWGGQTRFHFNPDALDRFGIRIAGTPGASSRTAGVAGRHYEVDAFPTNESSALQINHTGPVIDGVGGGALKHSGGLLLDVRGKTVDLRGFSLGANPNTHVGLAVFDAAGTIWFTADHAHPGFDRSNPDIFTMRDMNLRVAPALAEVLGDPALKDYQIGGLDFQAQSHANDAKSATGGVCNAPFPNAPDASGLTTDVELVYRNGDNNWDGHDDSIQVQRCAITPLTSPTACTASSTTGGVVITQDSSLINSGETAVAWYTKLTGNYPPYDNDQHPLLVWNLYRVDADGRIKQVGVSGVKHAFVTINYNCSCGESNVIYPTCEDTYAVYNNDNTTDLGPRSELIPYASVWGRCGSIYDTDCNGDEDDGGVVDSLYSNRMVVPESEMQAPLATGAHYYFEYWYLVRDDQNIYNTMGYREVQPQKNGTEWSVSMVGNDPPGANFKLGPVINQWVDPSKPAANTDNQELVVPFTTPTSSSGGHARVAVKATDLGDGTWRYEYAVMNFDYAHVQIDPAHPDEPNVKVDSNHGFGRFSVPVAADGIISGLRFGDTDIDSTNDWSATTTDGNVTWTAPMGANSLDWGRLYHFEFVTNAAPASKGSVQLVGVATNSEIEQPYDVSILTPQASQAPNDIIFDSNFE